MTDKDRIDYLTIMVAKMIQLDIYERQELGQFSAPGVYQSLLEMKKSIDSEDCVKSAPREIRI